MPRSLAAEGRVRQSRARGATEGSPRPIRARREWPRSVLALVADVYPGVMPEWPSDVDEVQEREEAGQIRAEPAQGHAGGPQTAWRLLQEQGFSTRANAEGTEGRRQQDRDAQSRYIAGRAKEHLAAGQPVISVDAEKEEVGGVRAGRWPSGGGEGEPGGRGTATTAVEDDVSGWAAGGHSRTGSTIVAANAGCVNVWHSTNTAALAVAAGRSPAPLVGPDRPARAYPGAGRLLICCDAAGIATGQQRNRAWIGRAGGPGPGRRGWRSTCCHCPPGTCRSVHKIHEHRLFAATIVDPELAWPPADQPLTSSSTAMAATTTATGLAVTAALGPRPARTPPGLLLHLSDDADDRLPGRPGAP